MLKILVILLCFQSLAYANACLRTGDCFEHEGQIIDLRSDAKRHIDNLNMSDASLPVINEREFSRLVGDRGAEYFIPLELRSSDMMILAGALSLGVVLFSNDDAIMDFVQDHKTDTTEVVTSIGNIMGREAIIPIAAGAYFIGAVMNNGKLKKVGLFTVAAGIATQIVAELFKKNFERERPQDSDGPYNFFKEGNNSFISGHASAAFSLATVIAEIYKDKPLVPYLAYGVASLTAYARMHDSKHWATDVMLGAVAGHLVTKIIMRSFNQSEKTGSGLMIIPQFGPEYNGLDVSWVPGYKKSEFKCGKFGLEGPDLVRLCMEEVFAQ